MGALSFLFYPWSLILQAIALVHFFRRRPDTFWLWIILIGGWIGAAVYFFVEIVPDFHLVGGTFQGFSRRSRIHELQALVLDNPSPGNYEELGGLYLDEGHFALARQAFDKAISSRTDHPDPFYRRALCALAMKDYAAAKRDLETVIKADRKYDYGRAAGLMAQVYAQTGSPHEADALFAEVLKTSTISETQYNYALFLISQQRGAEAREWLQRILNKKATLPHFLKRKERPWFRRAAALIKQTASSNSGANSAASI